jgi:hypothetical protein
MLLGDQREHTLELSPGTPRGGRAATRCLRRVEESQAEAGLGRSVRVVDEA